MLKKMFSIVMAGMALMCAAMPMTAQAYDEQVNLQGNKKAGATWDDVYHGHDRNCYTESWVNMRSTYNPVLGKKERIHYVLTNENEVLRFVYRENEVISVYVPDRIPINVYLSF